MWKRTLCVSLLVAGVLALASAPIGAQVAVAAGVPQETYPPPGPPIQITVVVGPTQSAPAPTTTGLPLSTTVIIGLLIILAIGVIVGGMALMSRRGQ